MRICPSRWVRTTTTVIMLLFLSSGAHSEIITNSIDDFVPDAQGDNNWEYGYFNTTLDGDPFEEDGYGYATDAFIRFDDEPDDWFWNGNRWDSTLGNVPWTEISATNGHPNGDNNGDIHFPIRRWTSNYDGTAYLTSSLRKTNLNCGNGTSVHLYRNAELLDTITVAGSDGNFSSSTVQADLATGDIIDYALSPLGTDQTFNDGCDSSDWNLVIDSEPPPGPPKTTYLADSADQFSTDGVQGANNWTNGYYNRTIDVNEDDGMYQTNDFIAFNNDGTGDPVTPDGNNWNGTQWDLDPDGGPWTEISATGTHPNGVNSDPNEEHWTVRRYTVPASAASEAAPDSPLDFSSPQPVAITWEARKTNGNGDGVTGKLFINGAQQESFVIPGNDTQVGVLRNVYANLSEGDVVELHLTPLGITNDGDGADGSFNRLTLSGIIPEDAVNATGVITDSITEFSGEQGQDGWSYGWYDQRADVEEDNGTYDTSDFIEFLNDGSDIVESDPALWDEGENHWNGGSWDLLDTGAGPWTNVNRQGGHPTAPASHADTEVHWAVRRWTSDAEGEVRISGHLLNVSANGDGTVGRIFVDGEEVWSAISDGEVVHYDVNVTLSEGSIVDFAIDSDGGQNFNPADVTTLDLINDGADGTRFRSIIEFITGFGSGDPCDFDGDGVLGLGDIAAMTAEIQSGNNTGSFDLNGDNLVDGADLAAFVTGEDKLHTWIGDANLDGEFNSSDFVSVFQFGLFETGQAASWDQGDWNGDGVFSSSDFVVAFQDGGFELGPRWTEGVASVPEPGHGVLLSLGIIGLLRFRKR